MPQIFQTPTVTVVIPTRGRPHAALRAVHSALEQSFVDLEIIVVIDGPDQATEKALKEITDSRLRILPLNQSVGAAEARNIAVREARGEWFAFLDDDDYWLPEKVEKQMTVARQIRGNRTLIACWYREQSRAGGRIEAVREPRAGEHLSEYLFCDVPAFGLRKGFIQTSTWLVPRSLALEVSFAKGLPKNQDTDWILRAFPDGHAQIRIVPDALAVFHNEPSAERVSRTASWRVSHDWVLANRRLFTRKAFSYFAIANCLPSLLKQRSTVRDLSGLLRDCHEYGAITPMLAWLFLRNFAFFAIVHRILAPQAQRRLRIAFSFLKC